MACTYVDYENQNQNKQTNKKTNKNPTIFKLIISLKDSAWNLSYDIQATCLKFMINIYTFTTFQKICAEYYLFTIHLSKAVEKLSILIEESMCQKLEI